MSIFDKLNSVLNGTYIDPRDIQALIDRSGCRIYSTPRNYECKIIAIGDIQMTDENPLYQKVRFKRYESKMKHDFGKVSLIKIKD